MYIHMYIFIYHTHTHIYIYIYKLSHYKPLFFPKQHTVCSVRPIEEKRPFARLAQDDCLDARGEGHPLSLALAEEKHLGFLQVFSL